MELVWIMSEYQACTRSIIEGLMKTPSMRPFISKHVVRFAEMMDPFAGECATYSPRMGAC